MTKGFTILLFCLVGTLSAQTNFEIHLDHRVYDDQIRKSQAVLPVFHYEGDKIESYSKFGIAARNLPTLQIRKLPKNFRTASTGYTFLYFSGADNNTNKGYLLMLIEHFNSSYKNRILHIDRNNNLDLTDDGPPIVFLKKDKEISIELENIYNSSAKHVVKLSKIEYSKNPRYYNLLQEHYEKHSGNKKFSKIYFGYQATRLNTLAGNYRLGNDSFTLALKDRNTDGLFNQNEYDAIYIGPYGKEVNTQDLQTLAKVPKNAKLAWNEKIYQVKKIDSNGRRVVLQFLPDMVGSNVLPLGKKIPKFKYTNFALEIQESKKFWRKNCYFFFWDKESLTAEDTTYLNKINNEFSEIELITFNHGDDHKTVRLMQYFDKISWPIAYSNMEIAELLKFKEVPYGIYVGKRRKLKKNKLNPKSFYYFWKLRNKTI